MNTEALILYVVFAVVALGWRVWLQWRRTGDTGLRMHAQPGTLHWWATLGFVAAIATGVAAPIAGLNGLDPLAALDDDTVRAVGTVLAVAGIVATGLAQWQMGASWRIGVDRSERTGLVTGGVFRMVRNPIYTAVVVTALGLALMVGNVVAVAGVVALVAALEVQVRLVEEPYLRSTHGTSFDEYAAVAGRFLPRIGRLRRR